MEKELLAELYRRYGQEIYRYLYAICRDRFLAEDILQDAFCKAILSLPSGHVNARAWFYMTGRNLLLNEMKKRKKAYIFGRTGGTGGSQGGKRRRYTRRRSGRRDGQERRKQLSEAGAPLAGSEEERDPDPELFREFYFERGGCHYGDIL